MFDEIIFMKHLSKSTLITPPPPDLISNSMILTVVNT